MTERAKKEAGGVVRRNIELHPRTAERLRRLKDDLEATSETEVIRRALQIMDALVADEKLGNTLYVRDPSGTITSVSIRYGGAGAIRPIAPMDNNS